MHLQASLKGKRFKATIEFVCTQAKAALVHKQCTNTNKHLTSTSQRFWDMLTQQMFANLLPPQGIQSFCWVTVEQPCQAEGL
jgi:hypothetical protein